MTKFQAGDKVVDRDGYNGTIVSVTNHEGSVWYDVRLPGGVAVRHDADLSPCKDQDFGVAFINFMKAAQERVDRDYLAFSGKATPQHIETYRPKLEPMGGPRFIRIVAVSGESRSAFGFIDKQTGDVLKAAGWKAPAKNFARGNIFDDQRGCGRISWTGVH